MFLSRVNCQILQNPNRIRYRNFKTRTTSICGKPPKWIMSIQKRQQFGKHLWNQTIQYQNKKLVNKDIAKKQKLKKFVIQ